MTHAKLYQDQWVKGRLAVKGTVECADRYEIIKSFCERQYKNRPFSICDIGANMSYFGLRLCEDFPRCTVVGFEYDNFNMRAAHIAKNHPSRLILLNRKLHCNDLTILSSCCHFDVVLVLNVLHHVGDEFNAWLTRLQILGDHVIAEFATSDSRSKKQSKDYSIPLDSKILGYGKSHIKRGVDRPIVLMSAKRKVQTA